MKKAIEFKYVTKKNISINDFMLQHGYSDSNIYYLINKQNILVNGNKVMSKNFMLEGKSFITVILLDEEVSIPKTKKDIDVLYEDEYLIAVNKPSGIEVEPSASNYENTLANYVANYYEENDIRSNIHLINRLDKLTSGIVLLAKNQYIHNLFSKVDIKKKYESLVEGKAPKKGNIKIAIEKEENSVKRIVSPNGKKCETKFKAIKSENGTSLVDILLITGRTHQIRVSFASIGHPLVGDNLYNPNFKDGQKMYLKAYEMSFVHPITKKKIIIKIK